MSLVGKNQLLERIPPRLRTFHTGQESSWNSVSKTYITKGTVAWKKAYMKKDYCQATTGYACERSSAGGSGVGGEGKCWMFPKTVWNHWVLITENWFWIRLHLRLAYRGCFAISDLPSGTNSVYESKDYMTVGFCIQVCIANNTQPKFVGVMVSIHHLPQCFIYNIFNANNLENMICNRFAFSLMCRKESVFVLAHLLHQQLHCPINIVQRDARETFLKCVVAWEHFQYLISDTTTKVSNA